MKKLWNRLSLRSKILTGTLLLLFLSFALIWGGQLLFFNHYYVYVIKNQVSDAMEQLAADYAGWESDEEINAGIVSYSNDSGAYLMILGDNGEILHLVSYEMTVRAEDGEAYRFALDNAVHSNTLERMNLKKGSMVTVEFRGGRGHGNFYIPNLIQSGNEIWNGYGDFPAMPPPREDSEYRAEKINGEIISISIPDNVGYHATVQRSETFRAAMNWMYQEHTLGESYRYVDNETGNHYLICSYPLTKDGQEETILAISPLRAVVEATSVVRSMVGIWSIVSVLVACFLALVLSRTIAKPIRRMSAVTKKMRNLDFSEQCEEYGQDEIGCLARDINDMSDQLEKTIGQLRTANQKLVADIEHERLLEQQRKEFVANASHELKTPLAIIRAYTEAIMDGISAEKQERYFGVIIEETRRMDALVLDMLENAKLESGALLMELKPGSLSELAEKTLERMRAAFDQAEILLITELMPDDGGYLMDKQHLDQVITNFLSNALHHTKPGGTIRVSVKDGCFTVENSGAKIAEEELERVWERFYKADKSRNRSSGGTGLGLAISKNILSQHGAEYGVQNTETGVKFWFTLRHKSR